LVQTPEAQYAPHGTKMHADTTPPQVAQSAAASAFNTAGSCIASERRTAMPRQSLSQRFMICAPMQSVLL
jgi:hypothetical protein